MPPVIADGPGRRTLDPREVRRRYREAVSQLRDTGQEPTVARLAAALDVSERTFRDWRRRFSLR